jgi:hypothetical protein
MRAYPKQTVTLLRSWNVKESWWPMLTILTTFLIMVISFSLLRSKKLPYCHTYKLVSVQHNISVSNAHGLLYVPCSTAGSAKGLHTLALRGKSTNVVYKEILCWISIITMYNMAVPRRRGKDMPYLNFFAQLSILNYLPYIRNILLLHIDFPYVKFLANTSLIHPFVCLFQLQFVHTTNPDIRNTFLQNLSRTTSLQALYVHTIHESEIT